MEVLSSCFSNQSASFLKFSGVEVSIFILLASQDIIATLPRTYPKLGLILSNEGELGECFLPPVLDESFVPSTGHIPSLGQILRKYGISMSKGIPARLARPFALSYINGMGLSVYLDIYLLSIVCLPLSEFLYFRLPIFSQSKQFEFNLLLLQTWPRKHGLPVK